MKLRSSSGPDFAGWCSDVGQSCTPHWACRIKCYFYLLTLLRLATHNAHTKYQTGKWVVKKPFSSINSGPVPPVYSLAAMLDIALVSTHHGAAHSLPWSVTEQSMRVPM